MYELWLRLRATRQCKITYLPTLTARSDGGVPFVKEWLEDDGEKV